MFCVENIKVISMKYIVLLLLFSACRGYHFRNQTNPFENYAVRTVAIPMFLNQTPVPNTSAPFTKEQYQRGLEATYSFMKARPQYYKFRKLDGMFNPLKILLNQFLDPGKKYHVLS